MPANLAALNSNKSTGEATFSNWSTRETLGLLQWAFLHLKGSPYRCESWEGSSQSLRYVGKCAHREAFYSARNCCLRFHQLVTEVPKGQKDMIVTIYGETDGRVVPLEGIDHQIFDVPGLTDDKSQCTKHYRLFTKLISHFAKIRKTEIMAKLDEHEQEYKRYDDCLQKLNDRSLNESELARLKIEMTKELRIKSSQFTRLSQQMGLSIDSLPHVQISSISTTTPTPSSDDSIKRELTPPTLQDLNKRGLLTPSPVIEKNNQHTPQQQPVHPSPPEVQLKQEHNMQQPCSTYIPQRQHSMPGEMSMRCDSAQPVVSAPITMPMSSNALHSPQLTRNNTGYTTLTDNTGRIYQIPPGQVQLIPANQIITSNQGHSMTEQRHPMILQQPLMLAQNQLPNNHQKHPNGTQVLHVQPQPNMGQRFYSPVTTSTSVAYVPLTQQNAMKSHLSAQHVRKAGPATSPIPRKKSKQE